MKKSLLFVIFLCMLSVVSAQASDHWLIVKDDADSRDVNLARQVEVQLEEELDLDFTIKLEKQVNFADRKERITIDIRRNEAFIYIGDESGFSLEMAEDIKKVISGETKTTVTEEPLEETVVEEEPPIEVETDVLDLPEADEPVAVDVPVEEVVEEAPQTTWQRFVSWLKSLFT